LIATREAVYRLNIERYEKIVADTIHLAETIMDVFTYFSQYVTGIDVSGKDIVALDAKTKIIVPYKIEHISELNADAIVLEPTNINIDQIVIKRTSAERDSNSSNAFLIVFSREGTAVTHLIIPPRFIEDVTLILMNRDLAKWLSEKVPDIAVYIDDVFRVSESIDMQSIALVGKEWIKNRSDDAVIYNAPLIIKIPINGSKISRLWIYREPKLKNLLGERILDINTFVSLELHINGLSMMYPIGTTMFKTMYISTLVQLATIHNFLDELDSKLYQQVKKKAYELLYPIGILAIPEIMNNY